METNSARRAMYRCSLASTRSNNSLSLALMAEAGGWDLVVFGRLRDLGGTKGRAAGCVSGADRFDMSRMCAVTGWWFFFEVLTQ